MSDPTVVDQKAFLKREGGSDKVYYIQLVKFGHNRFQVPFRYGKRSLGYANLRRRWKTDQKDSTVAVMLNEEDARSAFDKAVSDRKKHGYLYFESDQDLQVYNQLAYE